MTQSTIWILAPHYNKHSIFLPMATVAVSVWKRGEHLCFSLQWSYKYKHFIRKRRKNKPLSLLTFSLKVLVPKNPPFMGKMVEVDIYESGKHFMKGQPVTDAKVYTPSISKPLARGEISGLTEVSSGSCFLLLVGG